MTDLSVLIPARNEMFLNKTIENVLANIQADTEIIAVLDGYWPEVPIPQNEQVHIIHHPASIGQRAAINEAARVSTAKYIMKLDAHCAVAPGFDVALMADCEPDWTVIPRMYNLHAFDWVCKLCGERTYQGPKPSHCQRCGSAGNIEMVMVWQPRLSRRTDFARFDSSLHFQYWRAYEKRPEAQGDIADVMCCVGAGWFMERARYWELGGLDEAHGSWGQMGVELACKSWLSGGRQVVNKKTWFAHMFRTQPGFGFPYPNPGVTQAREHSRQLWFGNKWPKAKYDLLWLVNKFAPVPDWNKEILYSIQDKYMDDLCVTGSFGPDGLPIKGLVYYTDNRLEPAINDAVLTQLERARLGVISVSLRPIGFGYNIVLDRERGVLTMFKQILAGLEASTADIIFFVEHDVLYHPSHFDFAPPRRDTFYYNENVWKVDATTGQALFYYCRQTSGLCAYRELLLEHYRKRVAIVEKNGYTRRMGFEPGTNNRAERVDDYKSEAWMSQVPNIDIRHNKNLTPSRWKKEQFRNQKYTKGWTESDGVPGWGKTLGRFDEFLNEVICQLPPDKSGSLPV